MRDIPSIQSAIVERERLGFEEEVAKAFYFLEELGFSKIKSSINGVIYCSDKIEALIFHDKMSYELGFYIKNLRYNYSLSEIIKLYNPVEANLYRDSVAVTMASVHSGVVRVASLVRQYAKPALEGNRATFRSMYQERKVWAEELRVKTQVSSLKPKADEAFRLRKYMEASKIYEQIRDALSPAEKKKADLAHKRATGIRANLHRS